MKKINICLQIKIPVQYGIDFAFIKGTICNGKKFIFQKLR